MYFYTGGHSHTGIAGAFAFMHTQEVQLVRLKRSGRQHFSALRHGHFERFLASRPREFRAPVSSIAVEIKTYQFAVLREFIV